MINSALLYFLIGTILFFFWIYGIVSFLVDIRRQVVPRIRARWKTNSSEPPRIDDEPNPETEKLREMYGEPDDES